MMTCDKKPPKTVAPLGVGPCALEDNHHGPIHGDANGHGWQDTDLPDPEVETLP